MFADSSEMSALLEPEILSKMARGASEASAWVCLECGYQSKKSHVMEHVESKHVDHPGYVCPLCPKVFQTRGSLRQHKKHHAKMDPSLSY